MSFDLFRSPQNQDLSVTHNPPTTGRILDNIEKKDRASVVIVSDSKDCDGMSKNPIRPEQCRGFNSMPHSVAKITQKPGSTYTVDSTRSNLDSIKGQQPVVDNLNFTTESGAGRNQTKTQAFAGGSTQQATSTVTQNQRQTPTVSHMSQAVDSMNPTKQPSVNQSVMNESTDDLWSDDDLEDDSFVQRTTQLNPSEVPTPAPLKRKCDSPVPLQNKTARKTFSLESTSKPVAQANALTGLNMSSQNNVRSHKPTPHSCSIATFSHPRQLKPTQPRPGVSHTASRPLAPTGPRSQLVGLELTSSSSQINVPSHKPPPASCSIASFSHPRQLKPTQPRPGVPLTASRPPAPTGPRYQPVGLKPKSLSSQNYVPSLKPSTACSNRAAFLGPRQLKPAQHGPGVLPNNLQVTSRPPAPTRSRLQSVTPLMNSFQFNRNINSQHLNNSTNRFQRPSTSISKVEAIGTAKHPNPTGSTLPIQPGNVAAHCSIKSQQNKGTDQQVVDITTSGVSESNDIVINVKITPKPAKSSKGPLSDELCPLPADILQSLAEPDETLDTQFDSSSSQSHQESQSSQSESVSSEESKASTKGECKLFLIELGPSWGAFGFQFQYHGQYSVPGFSDKHHWQEKNTCQLRICSVRGAVNFCMQKFLSIGRIGISCF